jgi:hypothetical protein
MITSLRTSTRMEADRLNLIDNTLQGLVARAAELRRYL